MASNEEMVVYGQKDIRSLLNFLNSLSLTGIEGARRLSTAATILESGKPLEDYLKGRSDKDGTTEQDGKGGKGAD